MLAWSMRGGKRASAQCLCQKSRQPKVTVPEQLLLGSVGLATLLAWLPGAVGEVFSALHLKTKPGKQKQPTSCFGKSKSTIELRLGPSSIPSTPLQLQLPQTIAIALLPLATRFDVERYSHLDALLVGEKQCNYAVTE